MNKAGGFITLHRQILEWEWYRYPHTAFLFIHLLLSANYVDGEYKGSVIKRGQLVKSITGLSTETGLTIQTVKTALRHLKLTGEITEDKSRGYRVITIVKYNDFQKLTGKLTANQPQTNQQSNRELTDDLTADQPLYNNINNIYNKQTNNSSVRAALEDNFSQFWDEYPRKEAKQNAKAAWMKLKPGPLDFGNIMDGLKAWKASEQWNRDGGRYIPMPSTWINQRRWEDEVSSVPQRSIQSTKKNSADNFEQRDYSDVNKELMDSLAAQVMEFKRKEGLI